MRDSYVGLKGDWGTLFVGRYDTPLNVSTVPLGMFDDTMADYAGTVGFDGIHADNIITYITPRIGGFQFAAATRPGAGGTRNGDINRKADSLTDGYSLAATYGNGPWYASAAYEVLTDQLSWDTTRTANSDYKKWRVGLGIRDLSGFYLSAIYENQKSIDFMEKGRDGKNNGSAQQVVMDFPLDLSLLRWWGDTITTY